MKNRLPFQNFFLVFLLLAAVFAGTFASNFQATKQYSPTAALLSASPTPTPTRLRIANTNTNANVATTNANVKVQASPTPANNTNTANVNSNSNAKRDRIVANANSNNMVKPNANSNSKVAANKPVAKNTNKRQAKPNRTTEQRVTNLENRVARIEKTTNKISRDVSKLVNKPDSAKKPKANTPKPVQKNSVKKVVPKASPKPTPKNSPKPAEKKPLKTTPNLNDHIPLSIEEFTADKPEYTVGEIITLTTKVSGGNSTRKLRNDDGVVLELENSQNTVTLIAKNVGSHTYVRTLTDDYDRRGVIAKVVVNVVAKQEQETPPQPTGYWANFIGSLARVWTNPRSVENWHQLKINPIFWVTALLLILIACILLFRAGTVPTIAIGVILILATVAVAFLV